MHPNIILKENDYVVAAIDSSQDQLWEEFLTNQKNAEIYHHPLWLRTLENETKNEVTRIVCKDKNDNICGVFPIQSTRGLPFGIGGGSSLKLFSSLPRTPIGGPVYENDLVRDLLIKASVKLRDKYPESFIQIKTAQDLSVTNSVLLEKYFWRRSYRKSLPSSESELRFGNSRNHSSIMRAVNKSLKSSLTVRDADSVKELRYWYNLYLSTMRTNFVPPRSFSFFKDLWELLAPRGLMRLALTIKENTGTSKIIAGNVYLMYNGTMHYAYGASARDDFELRPNDLLHWSAIKQAIGYGYKYYEMGEVQKNHVGLEQYKNKWCSENYEIYHYYYPALNLENIDPVDIEGGLKEKMYSRVPLKMTEFIGWTVNKRL